MDDRTLDKLLQNTLFEGTEPSLTLKEEVWEAIEARIKKEEKEVELMNRKKIKPRWMSITAAAAAVLLVTTLVGTESGQAAVSKIRELLVPEKTIVEQVEGQPEQTDVSLSESRVGYTIYFDQERYQLKQEEGKDRIVPLMSPDAQLPQVYMQISQVKNQSPNQLLAQLKQDLEANYEQVENRGQVNSPLTAHHIFAVSGNQWNDTLVRYYLVDNGQGGTFVIEQQMFIEAEEGHGARFNNMLQEFRITTEQ